MARHGTAPWGTAPWGRVTRRALTDCLPLRDRSVHRPPGREPPMPPTDDVKNWMHMFRWIVKLIRDEFDVDEAILTRTAVLETDCGLVIEQVEAVLGLVGGGFGLRFPPETLNEVLRLEELCMLASWMKGSLQAPAVHLRRVRGELPGVEPGLFVGCGARAERGSGVACPSVVGRSAVACGGGRGSNPASARHRARASLARQSSADRRWRAVVGPWTSVLGSGVSPQIWAACRRDRRRRRRRCGRSAAA